MHEQELKKDMTVYDLAIMMMAGFDRIENKLRLEMRTGFAESGLKFAQIEVQLCKAENERRELKSNIENLKEQNQTRIEIVEDRTFVLKKTIEKELNTKIAW